MHRSSAPKDFEVIPGDRFADYVLVNDEPEVYEMEREESGYQLLLWTFMPAGDDGDVTPEPTVTATQEPGEVSGLPATGAGSMAANGAGLGLYYASLPAESVVKIQVHF